MTSQKRSRWAIAALVLTASIAFSAVFYRPMLAFGGLESCTYISDLVGTNPLTSDLASTADDHLRAIKTCLKATFANVNAAVLPTDEELNFVDGVTSAIQTQLDAKAATASTNTFTARQVVDVDAESDGLTANLRIVNEQSGTDDSVFLNATNSTDADFYVILSEVGAASKYAKIGPSVSIPLNLAGSEIQMNGVTVTILEGSITNNFGSISTGLISTTSVTVTGAEVGDTCTAGSNPSVSTLLTHCYVSATNTVQVGYANFSGASIDPNNATFTVKVIKQ